MIDTGPTEARLRDELSKRLQILEPELTLRSVEYRLPNHQGAAGKIDILAIDQYSATVIIELKKSDQTARQALHELHKYIALIKHDHGLRDSQIRCMLVSTEWRELLVPFSEFARIAPWMIDGYQLHLTADGLPDRAERIDPVTAPDELRLCREHKIYFFQEQSRRDDSVPRILELLVAHNLREYLLRKLDIKQRRVSGACDFALYLIIPEYSPEARQQARDWLTTTKWANDLDDPIEFLEEQFVVAEVTRSFFDQCDEREIGYPEKLTSICTSWDVVALIRGGPRLESKAIFSDEYLLKWAKGLGGSNAFHFEMIATPRRHLAWTEAKNNADYCLTGNDAWRTLVRAYLDEIERNDLDTTVTARIYNPCNLMMGLYRLVKANAGDMLPTAEIIVSHRGSVPSRFVIGAMVWNGKAVKEVADVLPAEFETLFDLFFASGVDGGPWFAEEHLAAQHGLLYVLIECTPRPENVKMEQLVIQDGSLRRLAVNEIGLHEFGAFYEAHQDYLKSLVRDFDSWARFG